MLRIYDWRLRGVENGVAYKKVLLKGKGGSHSEKFSPILLFSVEPYSQNGSMVNIPAGSALGL